MRPPHIVEETLFLAWSASASRTFLSRANPNTGVTSVPVVADFIKTEPLKGFDLYSTQITFSVESGTPPGSWALAKIEAWGTFGEYDTGAADIYLGVVDGGSGTHGPYLVTHNIAGYGSIDTPVTGATVVLPTPGATKRVLQASMWAFSTTPGISKPYGQFLWVFSATPGASATCVIRAHVRHVYSCNGHG